MRNLVFRRVLPLLVAALLAVSATSCGGSPPETPGSPIVGSTAETSARPTVQYGDMAPEIDKSSLADLHIDIGEGRRNAVLADPAVSDEVKTVLADGVLTFPEYEAAVLEMAACVRSVGGGFYRPDQPRLSWRGLYTYSTSFPLDPPGGRELVAGCVNQYVGYLDLFWKELTNPTVEEEAEAMEELAQCMTEIGLGSWVPESRLRDDFEMLGPKLSQDDRGLYFACAQRIGDKYALPYFGPTY